MSDSSRQLHRSLPVLFLMGSGGDGVITAGDMISRTAAHDGLYCHLTKTFGPQIRGGESGVWLQVSESPVESPADAAEMLLVFSWSGYPAFKSQLRLAPGAVVFQDTSEEGKVPEELRDTEGRPLSPISVPLRQIAEDDLNSPRSKNILATGFLCGLLGLSHEVVPEALEKKFARKGTAVVTGAVNAFRTGLALAEDPAFSPLRRKLPDRHRQRRFLLTGNDAVVLGALHSGVEFFAGYPITPASEILVGLGAHLPAAGGTVVQAEDEISSICMVIGASFGGKRAMTATSGPGLSLMTEALGLASHMEVPCVIVNVQRGGPSTGMPTKTEQSDLQLAIHGAHGDAPRVVIGPNDGKTCFDTTVKAFYLAEKYQTPVIVLSDQLIGHREEALPMDAFAEGKAFRKVTRRKTAKPAEGESYKRYLLSDDPVSPMAIPGTEGCCYTTSGIIHNEDGTPTLNSVMHQKMSQKIQRKLQLLLEEMGGVRRIGPDHAKLGIITWGSTTGAASEAAAQLTSSGRQTAVLSVELLSPLPVQAIRDFVSSVDEVAVVELSFSGQFARWLRGEGVPLDGARLIHRGGGDPFTAKQIVEHLQERQHERNQEVLSKGLQR